MKMKKLSNNIFVRNVMSLATGTLAAQLITILCSPIVTRLFLPEEYGILILFVSITSFISSISMFRYENAIVLSKTDNGAMNVISLCISLLLFSVLISSIIFISLAIFSADIVAKEHISNWYILIPLFVFIQGGRMILNNWNIRKNQYKKMSGGSIIRTSSANALNITIGTFNLISKGGLIFGTVVGQSLETIYLILVNRRIIRLSIKNISYNRIKGAFIKYINLFKINTPHILVDSLRNYASPIIISYYFSEQILGYYSLMFSIIMLPATLLGSTISQVFYSRLAYKYSRKEDVMPLVLNVIKANLLIAIFPTLAIFFFGEELFSFVFGTDWEVAGQYASALSMYMYIYFVSSSISIIPYVIDKMKIAFVYSVIINVSFFLIIALGAIIKFDFIDILKVVNIIVPICFIIFITHMFFLLKKTNKKNISL